MDPYVGKTIDGRYIVERVLGEGGMGIVYRGRHKVIDKKVAIKVLRGDMAKDREITERFLNEARAASSIGNAHIIDISDFGTLPDGSTYFVMEFLDGQSLAAAAEQQRPMPTPRILHLARQIADGLAAAHRAGIVHRDLKPDNLMLITRGTEHDFVKILDFGIAKVGGESKVTRAGSVFGTPHYMSPEQAAGTPVDLRTDIYALGIILYELASGRVPFDADNFMGILTQHMYKAPVPILATVPPPEGVPAGLDAVIQKCLSKKPDQRYATMTALAADLEKVAQGAVPEALPEMMSRSGGFNVPADYFRPSGAGMPAPVPATPAGGRPRWGVYAGVTAVVAAVTVTIAVLVNGSITHARPSAPTEGPAPATGTATTANTAAPAAPIELDSPPASTAVAAAPSKEVFLSVEPADAKVTRDGTDIGALPTSVRIATGQRASIVATRAGYKTLSLTADGSEERIVLRLERAGGTAKPKAPPTARPPQSSSTSIGDFQDPFLKK